MTKKTETTQEVPKEEPKKRLLRSPSDRMLGGVAGGLAKYMNVDPTFVRLGFVAAAIFGGLGILAYIVMAIVVPEDDGTGRPVEGPPPRAVRLLVIGLIGVLVFGVAVVAAAVAAWATATGSGAVVAGIVIALGVALAATAFAGGAAKKAAPWLLGAALSLAIPAGAVAASDVRFDGGIGERTYEPATADAIPADGYELGIGRLVIDLRDIDWKPGESVRLPAELGIGQMVVSIPSNVCVTGHAEAKGGDLVIRGDSNSGASPEFDKPTVPAAGAAKAPVLDLDGELQFGQLVVTDLSPDEFDRRGPGAGPGRDGTPDEAAPEPEACG